MITTLSVLAICLAIVVVAQALYIARQQATIDHLEDEFIDVIFNIMPAPMPLRGSEIEE